MKFHEQNFDNLPGQSSIYGVVSLPNQSTKKMLITTLMGKVFCCEYQKDASTGIRNTTREVPLSNLPSKVQLVAIDCCNSKDHGLIVALTFYKESGDAFLYFYWDVLSETEQGEKWNMESFQENCHSCQLDFSPLQLTHYQITANENVFLLMGCDKRCHVYSKTCIDSQVSFGEVHTEEFFPELKDLPALPTYLEMKPINKCERLTCVGYDTGYVECFIVSKVNGNISKFVSNKLDCPVSQLLVYTDFNYSAPTNAPDFIKTHFPADGNTSEETPTSSDESKQQTFNLIVVYSRQQASVFRNVLENHFTDRIILRDSNKYDVVTCCDVADVNHDGQNEIVIGTYGPRMLVYSFDSDLPPGTHVYPVWSRIFAHPVLKVKFIDLVGDGIKEIALVSTGGLHVLQHDVMELLKKCKQRMETLSKMIKS